MTSNCSFLGDLQEPFRWTADVVVMDAFECGMLDLPDFYFTGDDYRYRFEPQAKQRFLNLLRERLNSGIRYKGHTLKWDTVIEQKTVELGRHLDAKRPEIDFSEPSPSFVRQDCSVLRSKILGLSTSQARTLGISKSTLHHLRRNAADTRPFKIYRRLQQRLQPLTEMD